MPSSKKLNVLSLAKQHYVIITIFITPVLLFYWMLPFISDLTLGSDYIEIHVFHHLELMFSIKSGSFPLYGPKCFYGQSAAAYTFAQLYHPFTYIVSMLPGYWDGLSLEWATLLRLVLLAACHLALFHFFTRLKLKRLAALLISTIAIYNLGMLLQFWHSPALEAYTGFIFLCVAGGNYFLSPQKIGWGILITLSTYWTATSGYPPIAYYGLIGATIFILVIPFFIATILPGKTMVWPDISRLWLKTGAFMAIGILLAAAYWSPFIFDFVATNPGRIEQPYSWSVRLNDTLPGFINNFFLPLKSGFSMFGGSPLFLVAAVSPVLLFFKYKIPKNIWALIGIITIISLFSLGDHTPVHLWFWEYFPFVSAARVPAYAAMLLPLFLSMLLIWLFTAPPLIFDFNGKHIKMPAIIPPATVALLATIVYAVLPQEFSANTHFACPYNIREIPAWVEPGIIISSGFILLFLIRTVLHKQHTTPVRAAVLLILTVLQLLIVFRWGPMAIDYKDKTPTYQELRDKKKQSINSPDFLYGHAGFGHKAVVEQLKNYFMEPQLATIYQNALYSTSREETYKLLNSIRQPDQVVIEDFPKTDLPAIDQKESNGNASLSLTYSSYNRLVFEAVTNQPSFFVCAYPYTGHWRARVNDTETHIYRANGAAQAVLIPSGKSTVEFRYWSRAAFWGVVVSCLTLALAGGFFCSRVFRGRTRYFSALAMAFVAAALFYLWHHSLYTGRNLQTVYTWSTPEKPPAPNIAWGKKTFMSSHRYNYPLRHNSRHAVDGDRSVASCFATDREADPWWMVDLKEIQPVSRIIIYKAFSRPGFNHLPLIISISEDGLHWQKAKVTEPATKEVYNIKFEKTQMTRYITIQATGECVLAFNEVEVY